MCGADLIETDADLYCPNHDGCTKQIIERLTHFVSRDAMNIVGLSRKTIEALVATHGVKHFSDIYKITHDELNALDGFKDKR